MKTQLIELIEAAPWREAVTYRDTWPHEYVLSEKDDQRELLAAVCARFHAGEGVAGQFFRMANTYLFVGDHKYWLMTDYRKISPLAGEDNYVINRAPLYRDRRDFVIQPGDTGRRDDYPTSPPCDLDQPNGDSLMPDDDTLLAYLVPKLTSGVEDAATDALAFILNRSELCRKALAEMASGGEHQLAPLERASTQVTVCDGGRLDLVGYDANDSRRLIIESKFWAALLSGQASAYVRQLAANGPATLLFVAPEVRRETLWAKIEGQFSQEDGLRLAEAHQDDRLRVADVAGTNWRVALTSWYALLNRLESADSSMASNVRQLRSLADAQDDKAVAPLHADDFNPAIPRRHLDFCRIVDDVVSTGEHQGWISVKGLKATAQRDGYLRYFRFRSDDGKLTSVEVALYFSAQQWAKSGATQIWLRFWRGTGREALSAHPEIEYSKDPGGHGWIPMHLLAGVEYADVFNDAVGQVNRVGGVLLDHAARQAGDPAAGESVESFEEAGETGEINSDAEEGA